MPAPRRFPADFCISAACPPFDYDPEQDRGWILHFAKQDYRRASFLDERALGQAGTGLGAGSCRTAGAVAAFADAAGAALAVHIGYCGSTLTSRLLDLVPRALGLREPLPLLRLAGSPPASQSPWFVPVLRLLARRVCETQSVIVKPTSLVTASARSLLDLSVGRACPICRPDWRAWRDAGLRASILATEDYQCGVLAAHTAIADPIAWRASGSRNNWRAHAGCRDG